MYMLSCHVVFIWPQGYKTETSFSIFIYTIYSAFLFVKLMRFWSTCYDKQIEIWYH